MSAKVWTSRPTGRLRTAVKLSVMQDHDLSPRACQPRWQAFFDSPAELGESPFWHPHEGKLYWVDIPGRLVLRADVDGGVLESWPMPSEPGCIAPAASGGLVIALRHGVFRARQWRGALEHLATLDYDPAHMRANDGKCDALGRLWIGTIDESRTAHNAALYCLDSRAGRAPEVRRMTDPAALPITTANGLAWSPDGRTLYWADTPAHTVRAWDFDADKAALSAQRTFLQFEPKPANWTFEPSANRPNDLTSYRGRPDGACVDRDGNYLVAMYEGRRVCRFAPDGSLLDEWLTPALCPTMACLGGANLQTLFVTTAGSRGDVAQHKAFPWSGQVLALPVATPGLPVNFFVD